VASVAPDMVKAGPSQIERSSRTALIVGAGIGGLAAAVGLRQAGWQVRVFERASSPRELGFALMLAPNALRSLRSLGLAAAVQTRGVAPRRVEIRRPGGRVLRRVDLSALVGQSGPRAMVTLRQALHGTLLDAVEAGTIELDRQATGFTADGSGVTVSFADGTTARGTLLIGADGIGSAVRRTLHPTEPLPQPSGYVAVRGVSPDAAHHLDGIDAITYLGRAVEASLARASDTSVYWYLSLLAEDVGPERDPRTVLERHSAAFDAQFKTITGRADDLRVDELFEPSPLAVWGRGPVTLLGDAAHPMLPHAGQGAAQAMEDAVGLALVLGSDRPVEAALRHYEQVRSRRTRGIVKLSRRMARMTTTKSAVIGRVRDLAVRLMPQRLLVNAFVRAEQHDPNAVLRDGG
jgi:2-polyprenyl-6-methoxyphenol hydroxylase-like FAD-dependent oxidoreductase